MAPVWFSKEGGGGMRPVAWQGWVATVLFVVLLVAAALLGPKGILAAAALTAAYFGVIALTRSRD
ncbi:MAG: hypothetical protein ACRD2W_23195 [Acidimicrobiales bacterium]